MELLRVRQLTKHFSVGGGMGSRRKLLKAVDQVSYSIDEDRVMALVGESGCGKSTVARLVLRLLDPTSGTVSFKGRDIVSLKSTELTSFRKSAQIIFQDPFASLNPRRTVFDTVSEPLVIHRLAARPDMMDHVVQILSQVGLGPEVLNRYPHEFSGGQRQRICIARALAVAPELIVADEPLSALDVSIQAQILNLLQGLRTTFKITFLFISHDLRVVQYFSDTVGVMYLGKIVEYASTDDLFRAPYHPYTEVLLASAPKVRLGAEDRTTPRQVAAIGDVPSPIEIPSGCPFHPRCPRRFNPCDRVVPVLAEKDGRQIACHLWNPY